MSTRQTSKAITTTAICIDSTIIDLAPPTERSENPISNTATELIQSITTREQLADLSTGHVKQLFQYSVNIILSLNTHLQLHDVEEIVNEALFKSINAWDPNHKNAAKFPTFFHKLAINLAKDLMKKKRVAILNCRHFNSDRTQIGNIPDHASTEGKFMADYERAKIDLRKAVNTTGLSGELVEVIDDLIAGIPSKEIKSALVAQGVTQSTASSRVCSAKKHIKTAAIRLGMMDEYSKNKK